jgi:Holliday junction DNA helicase RuvA
MYHYLKGLVTEVHPQGITLDVNDIGYYIIPPNPFDFGLNERMTVYIHLSIKEDAHTLYGFKTREQKRLFEQLLSVKGIGPKSALAVCASASVDEIIRAIDAGDAKYLNRFPGIGPKASQQIILDLKGKIQAGELTLKRSERLNEVSDALKALGYKAKEIDGLIKGLDPKKDTATLIKEALKKVT